MLWITTWAWGSKYPGHYIERLKAAVKRNLEQEYRFAVFAPEAEDENLTKIPGCFCRLRYFSTEWQAKHGIKPGDRIVCIDLDVVITGPLDTLFDRDENFVILHGANSQNPCKVNGSLQMLRAGTYTEVWSDFSLEKAGKIPFHSFPDDQGWIDSVIPNSAAWDVGPTSGVYAFKKPFWPRDDRLPKDARVVAFPGWRDPAKFVQLDWIKRHWAV